MAKIARKTQKIFGSTSTTNQIAEFGSLAAGTPAFTTDPVTIQALSQYLSGWFAAVIGGNSPAMEDMNAICYLYAYQLAYIFQAGIPEWDAGTTYFIGSVVSDGLGTNYKSITDNNLNNALLNDPPFWVFEKATLQTAPGSATIPAGYNYNIGFLTVPTAVTYVVAGSLVCGGTLTATGTGIIQATGMGIIHVN